jgi:hypothetical protein
LENESRQFSVGPSDWFADFYNGVFMSASRPVKNPRVARLLMSVAVLRKPELLNAASGEQVWRTYNITKKRPIRKNKVGCSAVGPSGLRSDESGDRCPTRCPYVATGDNYSDPPT